MIFSIRRRKGLWMERYWSVLASLGAFFIIILLVPRWIASDFRPPSGSASPNYFTKVEIGERQTINDGQLNSVMCWQKWLLAERNARRSRMKTIRCREACQIIFQIPWKNFNIITIICSTLPVYAGLSSLLSLPGKALQFELLENSHFLRVRKIFFWCTLSRVSEKRRRVAKKIFKSTPLFED